MKLYSQTDDYKLYHGSMLDMLEVIEPNSIDSIVTDPPYELGFMAKSWDSSGIAFQKETWEKCFEVLKPGGYLLSFGGTRTFHRIAVAIEDAGFEIRDTIMWLYGVGMPKSMNISKGIEAKEKYGVAGTTYKKQIELDGDGESYTIKAPNNGLMGEMKEFERKVYTPQSDLAKQWEGWGTALKPAFEPVIVARKPCEGSCIANVMKYGVGGINIDECKIGDDVIVTQAKDDTEGCFSGFGKGYKGVEESEHIGRFPANVILTYDDDTFDEVCGGMPETNGGTFRKQARSRKGWMLSGCENNVQEANAPDNYGDSGSAARYFMNCKCTGKDEELWKHLLVNNAESNLEILKVTKENIAQLNVETLLKELKDHYAKYVDNQLDLIETLIVQDIVEILIWDFKIETSQVIRDFIGNYKKCTLFLNLVQFVEKLDNIDTTQTTQNLLRLFGYVKVVITNYTVGNVKFEQKRYLYAPKATTKDRDEGLDTFNVVSTGDLQGGRKEGSAGSLRVRNDGSIGVNPFAGNGSPKRNIHPTVKPTTLMQYLIRLVSPKGSVILDPFNGSGSTGKACMWENRERDAGYKYIGIELTDEYLPIADARISYVKTAPLVSEKPVNQIEGQVDMFDLLNT